MLRNEKYVGCYRGNSNYCPRIVPQDLFDRVQYMLSCNVRHNKKREYMFSGMIRCAECDSSAAANNMLVFGPKRKDGTRNKYHHRVYRCKKCFDDKRCSNNKVIYESVLERWLLENVQECYKDYIAEFSVTVAPIVNNQEKRKRIERKMSRLRELYINELITLDEYKLDRAGLQKQLDEVPADIIPVRNTSAATDILNTNIRELYETMDYSEKQAFWRSFIKCIYYDKDRRFHPIFY